MSTAPQYSPKYTVTDYQVWKGDWELWNGVAVAMTPSPFGRHGTVLGRITTALSNAIDKVNCDANVIVEVDWIVSANTVLRPDLTIVCGEPPAAHIEDTPALVVEVLSASTRERDLTFKRQLYAEQSVPWYLIVDPEDGVLHALQLDHGEYHNVAHTETLALRICSECSLHVEIDRLFR